MEEKKYTQSEMDCAIAKAKEEGYHRVREIEQSYNSLKQLLRSLVKLVDGGRDVD